MDQKSSQAPAAPTPLVVPKAFKYPEMYSSPTDSIMSPVSKGLLFARTRSKKSSGQLRNSSSTNKEQPKIQDSKIGTLES
ncbi:hypothetical protein M8C21_018241 [Ambrosia artemisiifolia]|uniref:Uncharacterized protein n=1 Tax=Ambrosia artemisiifolia TaxID=4212 RepID=A0AAD5D0G7_AMBAR|nr:hypothetical protein M8C21_019210 [Ambrosia artemisiifolia]KAI7751756.1 hypothetical protein M8C21_018241 [Ambrosia artemisiifolia]